MSAESCVYDWTCAPGSYCGGGGDPEQPGSCVPCWKCCMFDAGGACPTGAPCDCRRDYYYEGGGNDTTAEAAMSLALEASAYSVMSGGGGDIRPGVERLCEGSGSRAETTGPGCPCNATTAAAAMRCPAGYACSTDAARLSHDDAILTPTASRMGAACVACDVGSWCPEGTYVPGAPYADARLHDCPAGYSCVTPATEPAPCPEGSYCVGRSVGPEACAGDLSSAAGKTLLFTVRGNYCPPRSTSATTPCAAGSYCPTPASSVTCPAGSFCGDAAVAPRSCGPTTSCPAGSTAPGGTIAMVVIFAACVASLVVACRAAANVAHVRRRARTLTLPSTVRPAGGAMRLSHLRLEGVGVRQAGGGGRGGGAEPWLRPIDVDFAPCELNAVMGSSGCGKSTLLELIRGEVASGGVATGTVSAASLEGSWSATVDLEALGRGRGRAAVARLRAACGRVPQDDVVHADLTVRENLWYSARMSGGSAAEAAAAVDSTLAALGLECVRDAIVGDVDRRGVSGGQRKRVNIGTELVAMPSVLLMDEPTSGLDAAGSRELLRACAAACRASGTTIVAVVHQPRTESFMLFDRVLMLAHAGVVFCGGPSAALLYFSDAIGVPLPADGNPADAFMDATSTVDEQRRLAGVWTARGGGRAWVEACERTYPLLPRMLNGVAGIRFDARTQARVREVAEARALHGLLDAVGVAALFADLGGTRVSLADAREFVYECVGAGAGAGEGAGEAASVHDVLRGFERVLSAAALSGRYDTMVGRARLFDGVPHGIMKLGEVQPALPLRAIVRAREFGHLLMRRAGIASRTKGWVAGTSVLDDDVLLACLAVKAVVAMGATVTSPHPAAAAPPSVRRWRQVPLLIARQATSLYRSPWPLQLAIPLVAGTALGAIHNTAWGVSDFLGDQELACVCVGVLSVVAHMRTFSTNRAVMLRETEGRTSLLACFLAYNVVDLTGVFLLPLMFGFPYHWMTKPYMPFVDAYAVYCLVSWWTSGVAYLVSSTSLALHWANLVGVMLSVMFGAFLQGLNPGVASSRGTAVGAVLHASYTRWALEALAAAEFPLHRRDAAPTVMQVLRDTGFCEVDLAWPSTQTSLTVSATNPQQIALLTWWLGSLPGDAGLLGGACDAPANRAYGWLVGGGAAFRVASFVATWLWSDVTTGRIAWSVYDGLKRAKK